jgi:DNA-binding transcriptional LysR family regulator
MRHFVAVAEELHFGRAARRLNMAQPPLSQSIRRLEADLGIDLFDRSRRGVEMTAAGRVFLAEARRTLLQADLAAKLARREATRDPEVRVSFVGPALYRVLPELVVRHRAEVPGVHVRLFERASRDQLAGVRAADFDVGFVTAAGLAPESGCETLLVERASLVAAVPADSPLADAAAIDLATLAEQPFIVPPSRDAGGESGALAAFKAVGAAPRVAQEATQTNTTLSLVGAGLGCSLVMATAALMRTPNVRFLPILGDLPYRPWELMMIWHPDHVGRLGAGFVELARRHVWDNPALLDVAATAG